MHEHYNLYYIFLEDKLANPMPEEKREEVRKTLINIFEKNSKKIKPDKNLKPPIIKNKKMIIKERK